MKEIITFLQELQHNNNREWFTANKARYVAAQTRFNSFVDELIGEICRFDDSVLGLTAKDCTYRIYRDVRFSADKSPYKTHMGAFICPGGKKSGYSGYYFHIGTGGDGYPYGHMLATGDYCHDPKALQIIREDIAGGFWKAWRSSNPKQSRNPSPEYCTEISMQFKVNNQLRKCLQENYRHFRTFVIE